MPHHSDRVDSGADAPTPAPRRGHPWSAAPARLRAHRPSEAALFAGVYGLVLSAALAAALDPEGEKADPGADALWVLLTALTSAAAHAYAHVIAGRTAGGGAGGARSLSAALPLVAAASPTVVLLLTAYAGWWAEASAVSAALVLDTLALFLWGAWAARAAGLRRAAAWRAGGLDMLMGFVIIIAYALLK